MQRSVENNPAIIRSEVAVNPIIWDENSKAFSELVEDCPNVDLHISVDRDSPRAREHKIRDKWGCLWHFPGQYLDGQVIEHPLKDWEAFGEWKPPAPEGERADSYGVEHGFLFLRLTYLRGFENFMIDVAERNPRLSGLCSVVTDYWYHVVESFIRQGATRITFGDDLGFQDRLPISPEAWRGIVKPSYEKIFGLCRRHGVEVYLHTDGYIVDIIPDLIESGVTVLNPQDLVNGIDSLKRLAKGRVHIDLDIDRQMITVFGTPDEVNSHIRHCIEELGSSVGGLSLVYGVYPGTPFRNIASAVHAMQEYYNLWVGEQPA